MHPDEIAFQAALDAAPGDHTVRLVFADWLEEHGDPRAEGYRALGRGRRWPCHIPSRGTEGWVWGGETSAPRPYAALTYSWFAALMDEVYPGAQIGLPSRRAAEDAAALAFARLPPERRAELLGVAATA